MAAVAGFRGRVIIEGKVFLANRWSIDYTLESDDGSGTASLPDDPFVNILKDGSRHRLPIKISYPKIVEISIEVSGFYDTSHGYFTTAAFLDAGDLTPPSNFYLTPGRSVGLVLVPDKIDPRRQGRFEADDFLITGVSLSAEVRGIVSFKLTGKVNSKHYRFFMM